MREERVAEIAENRAFDGAGHVGTFGDLRSGNVDLQTVAIGVVDGGAVNNEIELGSDRVGHAHWARLAGAIHRVAGKRRLLELFAGEADGAHFGVGAGIVFAKNGIGGAHQRPPGFGVDNQRAEWGGMRRIHRASSEGVDVAYALFVERSYTSAYFCRGWHGAI